MSRLMSLIDPEARAAGDENNQENANGPGEQFFAPGATLGEITRLAFGLAALILGRVPALCFTRRGCKRCRPGCTNLMLLGRRTCSGFHCSSVHGRGLFCGSGLFRGSVGSILA